MKLYRVNIITGPGPKWDWVFVTANTGDEAIKKARKEGHDARSCQLLE